MRKGKFLLIAGLFFVLTVGLGCTFAYLTAKTPELVNVFYPGEVPPSIQEEFDGFIKQNVRLKNDGNITAYIRGYVSICWKDSQGNLAPDVPIPDKDYSICWGETGWQKVGDYFYCLTPIEPQAMTPILIYEVTPKSEKDGYALVVEVMAQTIQAVGSDNKGKTPMELAWNVIIDNGVVKPVTDDEGGSR